MSKHEKITPYEPTKDAKKLRKARSNRMESDAESLVSRNRTQRSGGAQISESCCREPRKTGGAKVKNPSSAPDKQAQEDYQRCICLIGDNINPRCPVHNRMAQEWTAGRDGCGTWGIYYGNETKKGWSGQGRLLIDGISESQARQIEARHNTSIAAEREKREYAEKHARFCSKTADERLTQIQMDTECIERIRTAGMRMEVERDQLRTQLADEKEKHDRAQERSKLWFDKLAAAYEESRRRKELLDEAVRLNGENLNKLAAAQAAIKRHNDTHDEDTITADYTALNAANQEYAKPFIEWNVKLRNELAAAQAAIAKKDAALDWLLSDNFHHKATDNVKFSEAIDARNVKADAAALDSAIVAAKNEGWNEGREHERKCQSAVISKMTNAKETWEDAAKKLGGKLKAARATLRAYRIRATLRAYRIYVKP